MLKYSPANESKINKLIFTKSKKTIKENIFNLLAEPINNDLLTTKKYLTTMCYCKLTGIILNFYFLHPNFTERQNAYKINKIIIKTTS